MIQSKFCKGYGLKHQACRNSLNNDINIYMSLKTTKIQSYSSLSPSKFNKSQDTLPKVSLLRVPNIVDEMKKKRQFVQDQQEQEIMQYLQSESPEQTQRLEAESIGRSNLIDQNKALRQTLQDLLTQFEDVQEQNQQQKIVKTYTKKEPQQSSQNLAFKKLELSRQHQEINKLQKHIAGVQRQLETSDIYQIMAKEDQLILLRSEFNQLNNEKEALIGHTKMQNNSANDVLRNEELYNIKLECSQQKLEGAKLRNQELNIDVQKCELELSKYNKNIQLKEKMIKDMEEQIHERSIYPDRWFYVTEEELAVLESRMMQLEEQKRQMDHEHNEHLKLLEARNRERQKESDIKLIGTKELEKELKMNQIKYKELAKLFRHNVLIPLNKSRSTNRYIKLPKVI